VRWLCAQAEAELDDSGQPVAINGTLQDLTERKLAEDRRVSTLEQAANIDRLTGCATVVGSTSSPSRPSRRRGVRLWGSG